MAELGKGIFTVPEAARLLLLPEARVRRWLLGTSGGGAALPTPPEEVDGVPVLTFADLVSTMFIAAFRDQGVSLQYIRKAALRFAGRYGTERPFSMQRFTTDGREIFEHHDPTPSGRRRKPAKWGYELVRGQGVMYPVVKEFLHEIDYGKTTLAAERWWPLGQSKRVVVDPGIAMGEPTVRGIPTRVLYGPKLADRNETATSVAKWFEIERAEVLAAWEYEKKMRAHAA